MNFAYRFSNGYKAICLLQIFWITIPISLYSQLLPRSSFGGDLNEGQSASANPGANYKSSQDCGNYKGKCACGEAFFGSDMGTLGTTLRIDPTSDTACSMFGTVNPTSTSGVRGKVSNACGPSPEPGCKANIVGDWGIAGQGCSAISLYQVSWNYDLASVIAYSVASVACGISCGIAATILYTGNAALLPAFEGADIACLTTNAVAFASDIAGITGISIQGSKYVDYWSNTKLGAMEIAGSGTSLGALLASSIGVVLGKDIGKVATKGALTQEQNASLVLSCVAESMLVATAVVKGVNLAQDKACQCQACDNVMSLKSLVSASPSPSSSPITSSGSGSAIQGTSGGSDPGKGFGGGTGSGIASGQAGSQLAASGFNPFPSGAMSAVTSGPLAALLSHMPLDQMPSSLQAHGIDPTSIAKKLASGQSPASVISGALPNDTPAVLTEHIKELEDLAKQGQISLAGGATMTSGGGNSRSPSSASYGYNGKAVSGSASGPASMTFEKQKPSLDGSNTDIWHSEWKGTIFQIVSFKLNKIENRLEQLEWASPLNRALTGLSAKPKNSSGHSLDSRKGELK